MSDITPIGRPAIPTVRAGSQPQVKPVNGHARKPTQDQVEFSDRARLLSRLAELPEIRQELVDRVKTEIELDRYETDDKINQALDALIGSGDLA